MAPGYFAKTQKRSNAPRVGHAFATNPLPSPWVARGLPGGRPLGLAADTRIRAPVRKNQTYRGKGGKFDFFHILMSDRLGYN